MKRRTLINLVFFNGVFLLMLIWAAGNIITIDAIEDPYKITGDFEQAAGVKANAEVTYLGVHYGRVSNVERTPDGVSVTMKIDHGKRIPADSIARIFRKSAIGEPYIDFVPDGDYERGSTEFMAAGDNVPLERTTVPLEFSELLRSASDLVSSIDPAQAGSLIHELSLALDGRGESLRTLTTSLDRLTASFVQKTEQLDRLAENNTRLTSVLADHRLSLGRSLSSLRALSEALQRVDGDTKTLLEVGPEFLRTTADLVADQKRNLDCLLTDLTPILRTMAQPDQLDDLSQILTKGPIAFGFAAAAVDKEADGPWVRVNLLVDVGGEDSDVYVPAKSLPAVPSVPACASTLEPAAVAPAAPPTAGGSGAPAPNPRAAPSKGQGDTAATSDSGGVLAALATTGGIAVTAAVAALLVGGLALWRARRHHGPGGAQ
ncbi:MAG TPA: MCE family protein [Acidimicrobiales bacterium]|jgi:phospholipid/cholesterol/gamma-HCH transport system substrate-binding protein|nr:MCE family protein [Acidimicrobiales bacterium]